MKTPLILDFDHSVSLEHATTIDLSSWQEAIRFGSSLKTYQQLSHYLARILPSNYGTVFMGSGDYHHISTLLIERMPIDEPFDVVIFDNHPDNMRFPFGIHCGSWVAHIAKLPQVHHIHVLGITSNDIGIAHSWENHLRPLYGDKLTYWSMKVNTRWAQWMGLKKAFQSFETGDDLIHTFLQMQANSTRPVYLSIDKDALSDQVVQTNWDQGILEARHMMAVIDAIKPRLIGSDVTGDVSEYTYQTGWKRLLSRLDQQAPIPLDKLTAWQATQNAFNKSILDRLMP
ncbi:arginase family protein [Wohlfahrtiimonas chitiniclastica]|uniref:arginase family protein n=1 Tax=Wohlfahrtiimonas chitiniclastica TaxID=400946 RepID=UPI001BD0FF0D|nr:arginase family protein [Wohlfahrtiimonas chitiniclastica]MBS7816888.1 arginase family protein [Wohlfahrtiimonas chitiniclastica]MBS7822219.1 arginase family protein [Wohlfahrtiimonas chitiniclastica]MBS7830281.1 arginase family protein [Wohlfahrtiimonas chitiniclastica]MBS7832249.1 arginase family protein [Wohlfahrtiimonas chitiniclastica]